MNDDDSTPLTVGQAKRMTRRGCCLLLALAFTCIIIYYACTISVLGVTAMSNFSEAQIRANTARVLSGMRTYETALEKYKSANNHYPPWSLSAPPLTTPVSYIEVSNRMIPDTFSKAPEGSAESWIRYATSGPDFLIWSVGPDGVSQITGKPDIEAGYEALMLKEYDATNGTVSPGDILRTNIVP